MSPKKTVKAAEARMTPAKSLSAKKTAKPKKAVKKAPAPEQKKIEIVQASAMPPLPTDDLSYVFIDYPTENESVSGLHYAIRIGSSATGTVEISIDNAAWQPCRLGGGYWWFDWGYFMPGNHKIVARLIDSDGKVLKKSAVRKCTVI